MTAPGVRTSLLLILARANNPVRLSAGGMYDLTLEAYATVRCSSSKGVSALVARDIQILFRFSLIVG